MTVALTDIEAAAARIKDKIITTPLLEAPLLNEALGFRLLVKAECLQYTGSFKARGAFNAMLQLPPGTKGVIAFSQGNHAQGVAYAGRSINIPTTILMPKTAPAIKITNTRSYGGEVVLYDPATDDREKMGADLAAARGLHLVKPYDDLHVIAGQGTVGLEIAQQCKALGITPDHVISPCSGGGLASGTAIAVKAAFPAVKFHTAEPEGFDDMRRSLVLGHRERNEKREPSICDALLANIPGELTFPLLKTLGATGYAVTDEESLKGMAVAAKYLKLMLEPGGAVAFAAAVLGKLNAKDRTVIVVASGGNGDPALQAEALSHYSDISLG
jgi:threonine dehydratase